MMSEVDVVLLINVLIKAAAVILAGFVIPWTKAQLGQTKFKKVITDVEILVRAAEQLYKNSDGAFKFEYVIKRLSDKGIEITPDIVDMIESSVYDIRWYEDNEDIDEESTNQTLHS